jgi:hypothetical protein
LIFRGPAYFPCGACDSRRLRALKEKDVGLVKLCETQREDRNLRTVGYLYQDIDAAGITTLAEEGIFITPPKAPKNFVCALMVHQIIASFAIGVIGRQDIRITFEAAQRVLLGKSIMAYDRERSVPQYWQDVQSLAVSQRLLDAVPFA